MKVETREPFVLVTYALVYGASGEVHTALVPYDISPKVAKHLVEESLRQTEYGRTPIAFMAKKVRHFTFEWEDGETYTEAIVNTLKNRDFFDVAWTYVDDETIAKIKEPSMEEAMEKAKVGE